MKALSPLRILFAMICIIAFMPKCSASEPSLAPMDMEVELAAKIQSAIKDGKAADAAQWAAAMQSLQMTELLRQEAQIRQPIAGVFQAFGPQLAALPSIVKQLALPELTRHAPPAVKLAIQQFITAGTTEQAVASVHGIAHANEANAALEKAVDEMTSGDAGLKLAKEMGLKDAAEATDVEDLDWSDLKKLETEARARLSKANE